MKKYTIKTLLLVIFLFGLDINAMEQNESTQIGAWFNVRDELENVFIKTKQCCFVTFPDSCDLDDAKSMDELIILLEKSLPEVNNEFKCRIVRMGQLQNEMEQARNAMDSALIEKLKKKEFALGGQKMDALKRLETVEKDFKALVDLFQKQIKAAEYLPKIVARMREVTQTQNIDFIDEQSKKLRKRTNKSEID